MKKTFKSLLIELEACGDAVKWADDMTVEEIVAKCHRGDWLLWLAKKVHVDIRPLTLAKAKCAKTVIHLMNDQRSINAVNIAEKFGLNKATIKELNKAAADAYYAAAYAAAVAAAAADASTDKAGITNQLQTANICREILGNLIINKVNIILKTLS